jgi:RNA polymerase sigma-54 factor
VVELNPDASPRLRINTGYSSLIRRADNSSENTYLKDHLQEARWFIKSLQSRSETLVWIRSRAFFSSTSLSFVLRMIVA